MKHALIGLAATIALVYLTLTLVLWARQENLLFVPSVIEASSPAPAWTKQPDVHESTLDVPGAKLSLLELRLPKPDGVVFFLHGNAGNNWLWAGNLDFYRDMNMDAVVLDYRGYGKSTGRISSEEELHSDVKATWLSVANRYKGKRVVFIGRSLGTGLAATLAASLAPSEQPDATILISPYSSMVATAAFHYPYVPSALLRYPLRTDRVIDRIQSRVVLIHGDRDVVIPMEQSLALKSKASQATFVMIPGAGHSDLQEHANYLAVVRDAVQGRPISSTDAKM